MPKQGLSVPGLQPGIHPVRGQIALLNTRVALIQRILLHGARYLVPRPDGRVLVGATEEDAGFDKRTTATAVRDLLGLAFELVPELANAHLERCWAGLRPGSPDGLPFLGAVPGCDNLFVAAGHFRAGLQLSPATGLVVKELLLGQPLTGENFRGAAVCGRCLGQQLGALGAPGPKALIIERSAEAGLGYRPLLWQLLAGVNL